MTVQSQVTAQPQQKKEPPPFMFCAEAILGLMIKGEAVTEASVQAWLEVVFAADKDKIPLVMRHVGRILKGPIAAPK